jgi:hypothetical protein
MDDKWRLPDRIQDGSDHIRGVLDRARSNGET